MDTGPVKDDAPPNGVIPVEDPPKGVKAELKLPAQEEAEGARLGWSWVGSGP